MICIHCRSIARPPEEYCPASTEDTRFGCQPHPHAQVALAGHYIKLTATSGGVKYDTGKPPMALLDRTALEEIAKVLAFGAKKYAAHNWRKGIARSRLLDAALRHILADADGEDLDPESGLPHLAHAGCCIMFALGLMHKRPDLDDRHKEEKK